MGHDTVAPAGADGDDALVVTRGKLIHLRAFTPDDLAFVSAWADDPELEYLVGSDFLRAYRETYDKQPSFYEACLSDPTQVVLMIVPNAPGVRPVGLVRLFNIHVVDGYASIETIVADRWAVRRGFGVQASRLIAFYGVDTLGIRRIECRAYQYNALSINTLKRNGFTQEGVVRQAAFKNGRYWDILLFGILRDEIEEQRRRDRYLVRAEGGVSDPP